MRHELRALVSPAQLSSRQLDRIQLAGFQAFLSLGA
jgi:hypothetical protein